LIYSDDANATRAFFRDVLGWKYVAEDFDDYQPTHKVAYKL
jgi:catechol 2,3-dioxygenase-like lactoylglutathione lyase family enzyme